MLHAQYDLRGSEGSKYRYSHAHGSHVVSFVNGALDHTDEDRLDVLEGVLPVFIYLPFIFYHLLFSVGECVYGDAEEGIHIGCINPLFGGEQRRLLSEHDIS